MQIIDTHCHLFLEEYQDDLAAVLERAALAGVKTLVNVGLDDTSSSAAIEQAKARPDLLKAVVGWHPNETGALTAKGLDALDKLAADPMVVAFGEIGLDFYRTRSPKEKQRESFDKLLAIGLKHKLPIVIHSREAFDETVAALKPHKDALADNLIMHCFTGDWAQAKTYLDLGFYLSFPGVLTFPKAEALHEAARLAPLDRILIETDGPFMAPAPFRGKRNEPAYLTRVIRQLAELRGSDLDETAETVYANSLRAFRLTN